MTSLRQLLRAPLPHALGASLLLACSGGDGNADSGGASETDPSTSITTASADDRPLTGSPSSTSGLDDGSATTDGGGSSSGDEGLDMGSACRDPIPWLTVDDSEPACLLVATMTPFTYEGRTLHLEPGPGEHAWAMSVTDGVEGGDAPGSGTVSSTRVDGPPTLAGTVFVPLSRTHRALDEELDELTIAGGVVLFGHDEGYRQLAIEPQFEPSRRAMFAFGHFADRLFQSAAHGEVFVDEFEDRVTVSIVGDAYFYSLACQPETCTVDMSLTIRDDGTIEARYFHIGDPTATFTFALARERGCLPEAECPRGTFALPE